jgi:hypothetical protein
MTSQSLLNRLESLPSESQKKVKKLISQIPDRELKKNASSVTSHLKPREFGCPSGKIQLSDDFDATPSEFREYAAPRSTTYGF